MIPVSEFCKRCGENQSRGDYVELVCTKVCIVKSMVFPVVMYGCMSWTIKKADTKELMLLNCGAREDSRESLGQQGDQTSQS